MNRNTQFVVIWGAQKQTWNAGTDFSLGSEMCWGGGLCVVNGAWLSRGRKKAIAVSGVVVVVGGLCGSSARRAL